MSRIGNYQAEIQPADICGGFVVNFGCPVSKKMLRKLKRLIKKRKKGDIEIVYYPETKPENTDYSFSFKIDLPFKENL